MSLHPDSEAMWGRIRNSDCRDCGLHEAAKTVCLIGDGPVHDCDTMVIGEAPGADEDEMGRPFVGKSGRVLTQALHDAGLPRNRVFITNMAKCRPPDNRTPKPNERKACRKYLNRELAEVQPRFILLLGETPLTLIDRKGIERNRGRVFDFDGSKVMATFHPAAWGKRRQAMFREDIRAFARLVNGPMI